METLIAESSHADLERTMLFNLRGAFVSTLQAKAVLQLTKDNLAYYDRLLEISRNRFNAGDIAQIDLDRLELQRSQYESDLQAAVALPQLDEIEKRLAAAQRRDSFYAERLANQPGLKLPPFDEPGEVRQWTDVLIDNRAAVSAALDEAKIGNRAFWFPLHRQEPYAADAKRFPNSTDISRRGLWLASRFDLTEPDFDRICSVIIAALRR